MAIQSNGACILRSSSSKRTEVIIQAPSTTFIINSTFASYLMLPHTPAPALAFTTADMQSTQSLAGGHRLLSKQGSPLLHGLATSLGCRKACGPLSTAHCLALLLRALLPRSWQHVALYSYWTRKAFRRFNTGRISRPNPSAAETMVASPERTGSCSWVTTSAPHFVSGYITLSKI